MKKWELLDTKKHRGLRWSCLGSRCPSSCCLNFFLIPVPASEVVHLSRYFPVVITLRQTEKGTLASFSAILKLKEDRKGCIYLTEGGCSLGEERPSFCKAYPFSLIPSEGKNLVAFDTSCPGFSENEGESVFPEPGKLNETFEREFLSYANFIKEDAKRNGHLLSELIRDKVVVGGKFMYRLEKEQREIPFNFVEEEKFLNLSQDKIKRFRGFISVIYAHLNSLQNFGKLLKVYKERGE